MDVRMYIENLWLYRVAINAEPFAFIAAPWILYRVFCWGKRDFYRGCLFVAIPFFVQSMVYHGAQLGHYIMYGTQSVGWIASAISWPLAGIVPVWFYARFLPQQTTLRRWYTGALLTLCACVLYELLPG